MARYRKVAQRTWVDEKFRALTPMPCCGQGLWLWLLCGPRATNIPGVVVAHDASIAAELKWKTKDLREAFREVLAKGMAKADFEVGLIWLPRATEYNKPESPNVVKSWAITWDEIPECSLKVIIWNHLKDFMEGLSKAFGDAFGKACRKPLPNQEHEQEHEHCSSVLDSSPSKKEGVRGVGEGGDGFNDFWAVYPEGRKEKKGDARAAWKRAIQKAEPQTIIAAAAEYAKSEVAASQYVKGPTPWLNQECWDDDRAAWKSKRDTDPRGTEALLRQYQTTIDEEPLPDVFDEET